ncbi:HEAT repeat domain-containing protein [Niabella yanshanensis]|uniref:HEAT repeat domain-containing protein n=1 Tax=Niabella yanshanensis TaxID=577386 RepID=A0ABZ0W3G0_9BACT|nr:HEAT repeat domain-containing protein [Niabella yanshanensis]WQD37805.1 HEAT repeat domain-containing protein [Niabella yanshanensis]
MNSGAFFRLLSPEHLYFSAAFFGILTLILVGMIYLFLYTKKKRFRVKEIITDQLNDWISEQMAMEEAHASATLPDFSVHFKKKYVRQFVTDNLINFKKSVAGHLSDSVVHLYEHTGLKKDSEAKMKSFRWHLRSRGIYELYMMQQRESLSDILDYTNSDNDFVRMEAQTAIVGLDGFKGLIFLNALNYPLHEWQQIKLLQQLDSFNSEEMPHLPLWLQSANSYVVHFALKLTEVYQQFRVHKEVVQCLNSDNHKIRNQAIKTLGIIAGENTVAILQQQYSAESSANKLEILKQTGINGTEADIEFLKSKLDDADDAIKLEAARAIVAINPKNMTVLNNIAADNPTIYSIANQIKYELAS